MTERTAASAGERPDDASRASVRSDGRLWLEQHRIRSERDLIVPLVDEQEAGRIYDPAFHRWASWGAVFGGFLLGSLGWIIAAGGLPIGGLGQWAASGAAVTAFTGSGLGVATGGLIGALFALYRMPKRNPSRDSSRS